MHAFHNDILKQFSESLGMLIIFSNGKDKHDELALIIALNEVKDKYKVESLWTGDINLSRIWEFNENLSKKVGINAIFYMAKNWLFKWILEFRLYLSNKCYWY